MALGKKRAYNRNSDLEDPLFELIQSMSPTEKRYFKMRVENVKNNDNTIPDYYILFQIINKKESFDEKKIEQELLENVGKKGFSNFTVKKNELFVALMRHLKNYHFSKSKKSAEYIKVLLQDANFLFKRGLYRQANKKIRGARKLANKCGDTLSLIEMNRLEREFLRTNRDVKMEVRLEELHQEEEDLINNLQKEARLIKDYDLLILEQIRNTRLTDEESKEKLRIKFKHLEQINKDELSLVAQRFLFISLGSYFRLLDEDQKSRLALKDAFEWWEKNELWRKKMPHHMIAALSNMLSNHNRNKDYSQFLIVLKKLEGIEPENEHERMLRFQKLMLFRQLYYLNNDMIEEACILSKRIEKGLNTYHLNEGQQITLIYNVIISFFINSNFLECVRWIDLLNPFKKIKRGGVKIQFSQILKIISYYELDEFDQMRKTSSSTSNFFKVHLKMKSGNVYFQILKLLLKLNGAIPREQNRIIKKIKEIALDRKDSFPSVGMEEINIWLDSKFLDQSMKSILLEKSKKNS